MGKENLGRICLEKGSLMINYQEIGRNIITAEEQKLDKIIGRKSYLIVPARFRGPRAGFIQYSRLRPITEEKPSSGTKGNYSSVRATACCMNPTLENWVEV